MGRKSKAPIEAIVVESGLYRATAEGHVWSFHGGTWHRLQLTPHTAGYLKFNAYVSGKALSVFAHRFVWWYLHGSIPAGHVLNHLNFDKRDNAVSNLEVVTPWLNSFHASLGDRLLKPDGHGRGTRNGRAKLTDEQVKDIELRVTLLGESVTCLASEFGVGRTAIYDIKNHRKWSHLWGP